MSLHELNELRTRDWAKKVGILDHSTPMKQVNYILKEFTELMDALLDGDDDEIDDALGDLQVTLYNAAFLLGRDLPTCHAKALATIERRNGEMVAGVFVKDES